MAQAPPAALMPVEDMADVNMRCVKFALRGNANFLWDNRGNWQGPRGTVPFWQDQEPCFD